MFIMKKRLNLLNPNLVNQLSNLRFINSVGGSYLQLKKSDLNLLNTILVNKLYKFRFLNSFGVS